MVGAQDAVRVDVHVERLVERHPGGVVAGVAYDDVRAVLPEAPRRRLEEEPPSSTTDGRRNTWTLPDSSGNATWTLGRSAPGRVRAE